MGPERAPPPRAVRIAPPRPGRRAPGPSRPSCAGPASGGCSRAPRKTNLPELAPAPKVPREGGSGQGRRLWAVNPLRLRTRNSYDAFEW